jgi:hypothetical protein
MPFGNDDAMQVPGGRPGSSKRSGSGLGSPGHPQSGRPSRGTHFGHHKRRSGQTQGVHTVRQGQPPTHPGFASGEAPTQENTAMPTGLTTYFPDIDSFLATTMDVYANPGNSPPLPGGATARTSGVNILITGVFPEGTRNRTNTGDSYTHVLICDPNIEVHDAYVGSNQNQGTGPDVLVIPSGPKNNFWVAIYVYITSLPGMGRKKIILADRRSTPGSWTTLL